MTYLDTCHRYHFGSFLQNKNYAVEISLHSFYLVLKHEQFFMYQMLFESICDNFLVFRGEHSSLGGRESVHLQEVTLTNGRVLEKCIVGFPLALL